MNYCLIYNFFDNASVAGLVTVSSGAVLGVWTFWKQRRQTKIENLSEYVELLIIKCEEVNLSLDRISNTFITMSGKLKSEVFLDNVRKEFSDISEVVNGEISNVRAKIKNYTGFYFSNKEIVVDNMISFFEELKKWHTNVINIVHGGYEFNKRIHENEKFDLKGIQDSAKRFVDSIK